jgi:hypothetical protein
LPPFHLPKEFFQRKLALPNSFWQKSLLSPNIRLYQEISRTKNGFNEKLTKEVFCWKKNLKRLDDTPSALAEGFSTSIRG